MVGVRSQRNAATKAAEYLKQTYAKKSKTKKLTSSQTTPKIAERKLTPSQSEPKIRPEPIIIKEEIPSREPFTEAESMDSNDSNFEIPPLNQAEKDAISALFADFKQKPKPQPNPEPQAPTATLPHPAPRPQPNPTNEEEMMDLGENLAKLDKFAKLAKLAKLLVRTGTVRAGRATYECYSDSEFWGKI